MSVDVDLSDLYREVILDHYKSPKNRGEAPSAAIRCEGANPLCGDEILLTATIDGGKLSSVKFAGHGCAISQASASMMTESVQGKALDEAVASAMSFKGAMKSEPGAKMPAGNDDLEALEGVKKYPVRIKCALLAWETLLQGIEQWRAPKEA